MTVRLGRGEDNYEALKLLSLSAPSFAEADLSSVIVYGSTFIPNEIYLWKSNGADVTTYAPTEAGLLAAIAASASGDSIWLPSMPIALTAGITLQGCTALVGIDEYSILNFSGFSGAAITMADNAVCNRFSVIYVASGATAIGIDARFAGAVVNDVNVHVFDGSSDNIAIWAGAA